MEVYSSRFIYEGFGSKGAVSGCTDDGRYMRINMDKCRLNKNSRMECPAMADVETSSDPNTSKLAGFLMSFYCSQSPSISKLF